MTHLRAADGSCANPGKAMGSRIRSQAVAVIQGPPMTTMANGRWISGAWGPVANNSGINPKRCRCGHQHRPQAPSRALVTHSTSGRPSACN